MIELNMIIISKQNPEWGEWKVTRKYDKGVWEIDKVDGRGGIILFESEFNDFWRIVKWLKN